MKVSKCDVLIIGGGAAGIVAGLTALKQGLNTIIVEREKNIGQGIETKLDLTESIGIEHIIKELKLPIHEKSNRSKWFSPNFILDYKSEIYDLYVKRGIENDSFDNINANEFLKNGGRIFTNTQLNKFEFGENNLVKKVYLKKDTEKIEFEPTFIIGADGSNSTVLQLSGLSKYDTIFGEFHAIGVYGKNFNLPERSPHIFFNKKIAPGGYIFSAKTSKGDCVLGVGFDRSLSYNSNEEILQKAKLNNIISNILKNSDIKNSFKGFGKYGLLKRHSIGNILLVGDAGRFGDPLFCYGVRQAILSGYNASMSCKKFLDSKCNLDIDKEYESSMKDLQNEIKIGLFFRNAYNRLNNRDIDAIVKIVSEAQKDGLNIDYIFKNNNKFIIKHIIKNMRICSSITIRTLPYLFEYLLKIRNM